MRPAVLRRPARQERSTNTGHSQMLAVHSSTRCDRQSPVSPRVREHEDDDRTDEHPQHETGVDPRARFVVFADLAGNRRRDHHRQQDREHDPGQRRDEFQQRIVVHPGSRRHVAMPAQDGIAHWLLHPSCRSDGWRTRSTIGPTSMHSDPIRSLRSPPRRAAAASASCACPARTIGPVIEAVLGPRASELVPRHATYCTFLGERRRSRSTTASRFTSRARTRIRARTCSNCRAMAARSCCACWSRAACEAGRAIGTASGRAGGVHAARVPERPARPGAGRSGGRPDRCLDRGRGAFRSALADRRVLARHRTR